MAEILQSNQNIQIKYLGEAKDGASRQVARLEGSKLLFEEDDHNIWITWLETPHKERGKGQAKTLIAHLHTFGKPISTGSFTKIAEPLRKYFPKAA